MDLEPEARRYRLTGPSQEKLELRYPEHILEPLWSEILSNLLPSDPVDLKKPENRRVSWNQQFRRRDLKSTKSRETVSDRVLDAKSAAPFGRLKIEGSQKRNQLKRNQLKTQNAKIATSIKE